MQKTIVQKSQESRSSQKSQERQVLPPMPPNRLVRPFTVGIIVEVLTVLVMLITLGSSQFSIYSFLLGLFGVLTMLFLITRGFMQMSRDEARARWIMWEFEQKEKQQMRQPFAISTEQKQPDSTTQVSGREPVPA